MINNKHTAKQAILSELAQAHKNGQSRHYHEVACDVATDPVTGEYSEFAECCALRAMDRMEDAGDIYSIGDQIYIERQGLKISTANPLIAAIAGVL